MFLSKETRKSLEEKLRKLNRKRPLKPSIILKLQEQFELEMTYNSNAIEGNTLTLKETYWVIQEGMTVKGKSLKEHLEAKNHTEALIFLRETVRQKRPDTISEKCIKEFHELVVSDSEADIAGQYRKGEVRIAGAEHTPPSGLEVPRCMRGLVRWWKKEAKKLHPIELATLLHHKFVNIHPFWDGNGRTGRLLMNIVLLSAGYPLTIILKNDRKRYYRVLSLADKGDYKPLCEFVAQATLRSLDLYLRALVPTGKKDELIELESLAKNSPYTATYLRKLANLGKLKAFKKGRNWLSTPNYLKDYVKYHGNKN